MTIYLCAQVKDVYTYQGSGRKPYTVIPFPKGGNLPSCTCTGFMTKRNKNANIAGGGYKGAGIGLAGSVTAWCKHLEHYTKTVCQYTVDDKGGSVVVPERCPRCSGPLVSETGKVVVDTSSATAGLLAIVADLTGKEVIAADDPDPDPDPEPELPTNQDASLINAIVGKEVFAPPAPPEGKADFDPDAAVAELTAMLKGK